MDLFSPGKRVRPRRFSYEPRFYAPEKDERLKRQIRISRSSPRKRAPTRLLFFIILLALILFVYLSLD